MKTSNNSKYDFLFKHNIKNYVKNIIIYNENDNWIINQNYNSIPDEEHEIWKNLFGKVFDLAYMYSCKEYRSGINFLINEGNDIKNNMPNLDSLSKLIYKRTNWNIQPVAGFVDEAIFFELLKNKQFPSSDIIRKSKRFYNKYKNTSVMNNLSYTPEPDIFHEIFGHSPFLFNKDYCDLLQHIGERGCQIINSDLLDKDLKSHNLKRLQNFVWWTLEFGIMSSQNEYGFEIYGAGILSSYDEILNVVNNYKKQQNIKKYNVEEIVMTRFDYSKLQDQYFIIDSFEDLIKSYYENQYLFNFKG